jgi:hypothetical protein
MNSQTKIIGIPFVSYVDSNLKPTLDVAFLKRAYTKGFTNNENLLRNGVYKLMGYRYDFKKHLKKYLYLQYGQWHQVYAPNKTLLREVVFGYIERIIEI